MILAIDVDYKENEATVAGVLFERWDDKVSFSVIKSTINNIEPYISGQFYKRELPCILRLLDEHDVIPEYIVVDGHVFLDGNKKPGLGKYLFDSLNCKIPIIGVAKKAFFTSSKESEIYRGMSKKALFITSIGIELELAKKCIESMDGQYRLPTLLKQADKECRKKET